MALLDGTGWQLMVWWRLKKLVIAGGLGKGKSEFLWRDYCSSTACWDPKCAAWSVELVIKRGGWRKSEPFPWKQHSKRSGMCKFQHLQALRYCLALVPAAEDSIKHPSMCCRSRNASLHLVLLFSTHNGPLPWLILDNIIYSIRCQNVGKNVKEPMELSLYLLITWRKKKMEEKKSDEIVVRKLRGGKLDIKV